MTSKDLCYIAAGETRAAFRGASRCSPNGLPMAINDRNYKNG